MNIIISDKAQAIALANTSGSGVYWYSSGRGRIELALSLEDAKAGSHQGRCDDDIAYLLTVPYIQEQLEEVSEETLRGELEEYGAWDETELADHDANLARLLWLACGDIREEHS